MVKDGQENVFEIVRETLLPPNEEGEVKTEIKVGLQNRVLQPEDPRPPIRAESGAINHTFYDVNGFCDYLLRYGGPFTVILACVNSCFMKATLNEQGELGRETIDFQPQFHPLFVPWLNMAGKMHPILSLVENLMDNRRSVLAPDAKTMILMLSQLRVKKDVDIQIGFGTDCINGLMVKARIQGTENSYPVDLPDHLTINAPIFVGTEPQSIDFDLTVLERDDKVWVKISCADLVVQKTKAFEAMLETVRAKVLWDDERPVVGMGVIGYQEWIYLR